MKRKILFFTEIIILLFLFVACLHAPVTVFECSNNVLTKNEETGYYIGECFALRPGVYRICILPDGEAGVGAGLEIGLDAQESNYHSIRGNRGIAYAGTGYKEVIYYVTANIPAAYVTVQPFSEEAPAAYTVQVDRTAAGCRILAVMAAVVFVLLDILLLFHDRVVQGKVTQRKKWIFAAVMGTVLALSIPLTADWLIPGEGGLQCLKETEAMLRGEIGQVPIWHLSYLWLPVLFRRIGFPVMTAYKILQFGLIVFAVLVFYIMLSTTWKEEQWFLPGIMLGAGNPIALTLLYKRSDFERFLLYVAVGSVLLAVMGWALQLSKRKISSWLVFAAVLVLLLQAVYFENRLTFQSEPLYWYNAEPFMTGDTQL